MRSTYELQQDAKGMEGGGARGEQADLEEVGREHGQEEPVQRVARGRPLPPLPVPYLSEKRSACTLALARVVTREVQQRRTLSMRMASRRAGAEPSRRASRSWCCATNASSSSSWL